MNKWNKSLFDLSIGNSDGWNWDDSKSRVDAKADKLYGGTKPALPGTFEPHFPNITYCMNKLTDPSLNRIYMRFPIMPAAADYNNMTELDRTSVVVYQSGVWSRRLKSEFPNYLIGAD